MPRTDMKRLLKLLSITTLILPLFTGAVAVLSGFGDPWGMGGRDPLGIFVTAALPILPPGIYQIWTWPMTYGVAVLLSPLALLRQRYYYLVTIMVYVAVVAGGWSIVWVLAPDRLNVMFDGTSFNPGHLNSVVWKFGVFLLTDSVVLIAATCWWFWRGRAPVPSTPGAA